MTAFHTVAVSGNSENTRLLESKPTLQSVPHALSWRSPILFFGAVGLLVLVLAAATSAFGSDRADQATFPRKPIKIMVPAKPGGGWDQLARLIQRIATEQQLSPVSLEVINRGGAGGTIGLAELVGRHRADPYMVMIGGGVMTGAVISHNSPYKLTDTTPLARLVSEYEIVAVPFDSPYQSLADLVQAFQADPESFSWGGGSAGGIDHMLVGLLADAAGIDPTKINYVAFTGGGEAGAAVIGGQVDAGVSGLAEWDSLVKGKRMRVLGISSPERIVGYGSIPTLKDGGMDIVLENWRSIMAPPEITPQQKAWFLHVLSELRGTKQWQDILKRNGWEDTFLTGADFDRFIQSDIQSSTRILDKMGISNGGEGYSVVGPYVFPSVMGVGMAIALFFIWRGYATAGQNGAASDCTEEATETDADASVTWKKFGMSFALLGAYIISLRTIGFLISTPFFMVAVAYLIGNRQFTRNAVAGSVLTVAVFLIFTRFLNVEIP